MKISTNKEQITLNNVLIGEVWMGSGQSNMEMPMAGYNNQPINDSNELILSSKNQQIRLFTVKRKTNKTPLYDCEGSWQEASPKTVADFSAVAYNFAKKFFEYSNGYQPNLTQRLHLWDFINRRPENERMKDLVTEVLTYSLSKEQQ